MTIQEKNILIATKLLGAEFINNCMDDFPNGYYMFPNESKFSTEEFYFGLPLEAKDFEFHCNWNWLMLAVDEIIEIESLDKINRLDIANVFNFLAYQEDKDEYSSYINIRTIEDLFNAVVNYILSKK